jgi:hypothetical protein
MRDQSLYVVHILECMGGFDPSSLSHVRGLKPTSTLVPSLRDSWMTSHPVA